MSKEKIIRITAESLIVAVALLVLFSCISFDIGDPPSQYVIPANHPVHNWCGPLGAWIAYYLLYYVGPGALLLCGALIAWLGIDLAKKDIDQPIFRVLGLCMLAAAASATFHLIWPDARVWPFHNGGFTMGNGGILGSAISGLLTRHVAGLGTFIVLCATWFVGAVLLADKAFLWLIHKAAAGLFGQARKMGAAVADLKDNSGELLNIWKRLSEKQKEAAEKRKTSQQRGAELLEKRSAVLEEKLVNKKKRKVVDLIGPKKKKKARKADPDQAPDADDAGGVDSGSAKSPGKSDTPLFDTKPARAATQTEVHKQEAPAASPVAQRKEKPYVPRTYDDYTFPPIDLLAEPEYGFSAIQEKMVGEKAHALELLLAEFGIDAQVVNAEPGPAITMYELKLAPGIKVSQVNNLSNDMARALEAGTVRVVAPLPGKNTIGIEVPNTQRETVRIKELINLGGKKFEKMAVPLFLGKDSSGQALISDLATMPHLLIAGTTGSGKSVCINSIITSILMTRRPDEVKLILVDPKMVEMACFDMIPHLMCPTVTDTRRAEQILEWATTKMDERYELLAEAKVRNIGSYNNLSREEIIERFQPSTQEEEAKIPKKLPYIVIIIDELADLMMTSGKEVEGFIVRIAQKSRAVGIHLVVATQRPQATVVTGLIKSNMPARISFRVAARMDSRIILDQNGGETLLGQGDMLFLIPGTSDLVRSQGAFLDDREIREVVGFLKDVAQPQFHPELMQLNQVDWSVAEQDQLFDDAVEIVLETKRGSVSLLQRRLSIGYARASRMIEMMAAAGVLGEYKGSQAREVMMTAEEWENAKRQRFTEGGAGMNDADMGIPLPEPTVEFIPPERAGAESEQEEPEDAPEPQDSIDIVEDEPEEEEETDEDWEEDEDLDEDEEYGDDEEYDDDEEYEDDEDDGEDYDEEGEYDDDEYEEDEEEEYAEEDEK